MANKARKARKKLQRELRLFGHHDVAASLYDPEPKRPTGRYQSKAERQEERARSRKLDQQITNLAALAAGAAQRAD